MIGKTLAHYRITAKLGQGGMGEVYRATDERLNRDVAIKVLPDDLVGDTERLARFDREAQLLAALNHPNIAQIYGVEEHQGTRAIVLELIGGETLADRVAHGPLATDDALAIAAQIALALEAAHERGIVHRDLKPANVKVTEDGTVKVLDFGLAKALSPETSGSDPSDSPTMTAATRAGTILGTAAYMAPEQARGKPVDRRADIWAFGCVLFELLTGERPFRGSDVSEVLAHVITKEPDLDRLPPTLPASIRDLIARCLRKDPRLRLPDIGVARIAIAEAGEGESAASAAPTRAGSRLPRPAVLVLTALVALAAGFGLARLTSSSPDPREGPTTHVSIQLPDGWRVGGWGTPLVALSPDGRTIAYVAERGEEKQLFVQRLGEPEAVPVPDSSGAEGPFFSSDGRHVAFGAGRISGQGTGPPRLRRYAIERRTTDVVCEIEDYFGGAWRDDDVIFFAEVEGTVLMRVAAGGGTPEPVLSVAADDSGPKPFLYTPELLPGGERLLGVAHGRAVVLDVGSGASTDLGVEAVFVRTSPNGELLAGLPDGRVLATSFDTHSLTVGSDRRLVLEDVARDGLHAPVFAVSAAGDVVYARGRLEGTRRDLARLVWVRDDGAVEPLEAFAPDEFSGLALSPDGRRIAVTSGYDGIAVLDIDEGTRLPLAGNSITSPRRPLWTPDGKEIVFSASPMNDSATTNLFAVGADAVTAPRRLDTRGGEFYGGSFVPGTRRLVHGGYLADKTLDYAVFEIDLDEGHSRRLFGSEEGGIQYPAPAVSPDGKWLAYVSEESGSPEIFLRSFPDLARKVPVGEGRWPEWSSDGKRLYYQRGTDRFRFTLWFREVSGGESRPRLSPPRKISDDPTLRLWSVDPLGRGLLALQTVPTERSVDHFYLVKGWAR